MQLMRKHIQIVQIMFLFLHNTFSPLFYVSH